MNLDEIIDAIAQTRGDRTRYSICADALLAAGEPQGQLMAMQLQGMPAPELEAEMSALVRELLGLDDEDDLIEWRWGFVSALRLGGRRSFSLLDRQLAWLTEFTNTSPELVPALPWAKDQSPADRLRAHRLLRQLATLHVGPWEIRPHHDVLWDHFEQHGLPRSITELVIDDVPVRGRDEHQITWVELGDLSDTWPAFSRLTDLTLRGSWPRLGEIRAPALRRFSLLSSTFNDVSAIRGAQWPALEELSLSFGDGQYQPIPVEFEDVRALVRELPPTVRKLGLRNLLFTDLLVPVLAKSRVLPQLTHLDLSLGVLFQAERLFEEHAAAFRHLEVLDVTNTGLEIDALRRLIPGLQRGQEWRAKRGRYVSISE